MIVIPVAEAKARFSEYLKASESELVVVTKKGRPTAVLVSLSDDELEDLILSRSPKMRAFLDQAWEDIQAGRGVPHADFWQQFNPENAPTPAKPAQE
jgi:prevent-host-death family protein